jgi:hypothetical protein
VLEEQVTGAYESSARERCFVVHAGAATLVASRPRAASYRLARPGATG